MEIILDGKKIFDKKSLYNVFKNQFTDLYGENLDALWDVLSYYTDKVKVVIINLNDLKYNLGNYIDQLMNLFNDLSKLNTNFSLEIK